MNTEQTTADEDIEGLGNEVDDVSLGGFSTDELHIRNETRTVHAVLRGIEKGSFVMNPDFQRDFVWSSDRQGKLVESVLMRIPLPVFYLAEDEEGRLLVVDGLQRLSTLQRFAKNELQLKSPSQKDLDGKYFRDLSPKMQSRFEDCNLIVYVIDAKVPEQVRLDIFDRVNSGISLTRQQMRNCLYMGPATRFLKEEVATQLFLGATGKSLQSKTMRDREFVNRFCAFQVLPIDEYDGDMDAFLAQALKTMNQLPENRLKKLSREFRAGLANNFEVFGSYAFRKHTKDQVSHSALNAALWDVMSTVLSQQAEEVVEAKASKIRSAFFGLLKDKEFVKSISEGTSQTKNVLYRFEAAQAAFQKAFKAK